jgi:beta-mannan synthase
MAVGLDLSLRAYLKGWKFTYLHDVECLNELPNTFEAYRTQQFRWLAGPMQIFRKSLTTIFKAENVSFMKKISCYIFFIRYILFAFITLVVLVVPPVELWVDPWVWSWQNWYFMASVNGAVILYFYITIFSLSYLLFAVSVGYFKTFAMITGMLNLQSSKSWVVTPKFGKGTFLTKMRKPYLLESLLTLYYMGMMIFTSVNKEYFMGGYLAVMSIAFAVSSFGDIFVSSFSSFSDIFISGTSKNELKKQEEQYKISSLC